LPGAGETTVTVRNGQLASVGLEGGALSPAWDQTSHHRQRDQRQNDDGEQAEFHPRPVGRGAGEAKPALDGVGAPMTV